MRIEAHNRFGQPLSAEVTRVVIYNDYDLPVAVAVKQEHGWIYVAHCRDAEFFDYLSNMGIKTSYQVDTLDVKKLKPLKPG